ncbi:hypothetical protein P3T22_006685 [Paraburkholderia sp. GAS348]
MCNFMSVASPRIDYAKSATDAASNQARFAVALQSRGTGMLQQIVSPPYCPISLEKHSGQLTQVSIGR